MTTDWYSKFYNEKKSCSFHNESNHGLYESSKNVAKHGFSERHPRGIAFPIKVPFSKRQWLHGGGVRKKVQKLWLKPISQESVIRISKVGKTLKDDLESSGLRRNDYFCYF